jgi:hypothetical protein
MTKVRSWVWHVRSKTDDSEDPDIPVAPINMVFMLRDFMAPIENREESELEQSMAQLNLEPMPATFKKPEEDKHRHLKALYMKGHIDGKPVTKMLVDGGAAVNIMS